MRTEYWLVAVVLAAGAAGTAQAGCTVPFTLTVPVGTTTPPATTLLCYGPWLRASSCHNVEQGQNSYQFYCADQTIFSMWGSWSCDVFTACEGFSVTTVASVDFCIESTGPSEVDLVFDGNTLGVNASDNCSQAEAAAVLGHRGEAAAAGASRAIAPGHPLGMSGRDRDTFDFTGEPGETVDIRLDRDGTGGGDGDVAALRVTSQSGELLAHRTGELPLELSATVVDLGVTIAVREAASGEGRPYRGSYILSLKPAAGAVGERAFRPRPDVEP